MRLANWKRADRKFASGKIANAKKAKGFTLIELMIVVAIIGILSMIGIPAYNDYVTRGKLVDATSKLADMRIQLEQYYQDNRNYGSTSSSCGIAMPTSKYFTISCKWGASSRRPVLQGHRNRHDQQHQFHLHHRRNQYQDNHLRLGQRHHLLDHA